MNAPGWMYCELNATNLTTPFATSVRSDYSGLFIPLPRVPTVVIVDVPKSLGIVNSIFEFACSGFTVSTRKVNVLSALIDSSLAVTIIFELYAWAAASTFSVMASGSLL